MGPVTPSVWLPLEWGPLYSQTRESLEAESCSYYVSGTQVIPRWPAQSLLTSEALGWKFLVLPEQDPPRHGVILPVLPGEGPRAPVHPSKAAEWQHRSHCIPWRPQGGCVMEAFHAPGALHHPPPLLVPLHGPDHPGRGPLGSACRSEGPRPSVAERPQLHSPPAALPTGCPAPPAS